MYNAMTGQFQSVNIFLDEVHKAMEKRYILSSQASKDKKDAVKLQTFLQGLKDTAVSENPFSNTIAGVILEQIQANHRQNYKIGRLFQRKTGKKLEDELTDIVMAVYEQARSKGILAQNITDQAISKNINTGGQKGTIVQGILDETTQAILKTLGQEVKQAIDQAGNRTTAVSAGQILIDVQQKTDVKGLNVDIPISVQTNDFVEILSIINRAKISAKNYSSVGRAQQKLDELVPNLHLGKSNIYRAVAGPLASLGYEDKTINSAFNEAVEDVDPTVRAHIYHLRYIYELTGAGIVNIKTGEVYEEVNFLVYNDPSGSQIYVSSVAEILAEVLEDKGMFISDDPFEAITIKKSYFKNKNS